MSVLDLMVVMPVYNEEACIISVIQSWKEMLNKLNIRYRLLVLNDGSADRTQEVLSLFSSDPQVQVVHKTNSGHGPTILSGYRMACEEAEWVFQCDSDAEMGPDAFPELWAQRAAYDALMGYRRGRVQSRGRAWISACSRTTVRLFFGPGISDVNTPYRLMRADVLRPMLTAIPNDTFAPNIILSGEMIRRKVRILEMPVDTRIRSTGRCSIVKWGLIRAAMRSFFQIGRYFLLHFR